MLRGLAEKNIQDIPLYVEDALETLEKRRLYAGSVESEWQCQFTSGTIMSRHLSTGGSPLRGRRWTR